MKRHEFEQECLQMILDKKPEDFLIDNFPDEEMQKFRNHYFNSEL